MPDKLGFSKIKEKSSTTKRNFGGVITSSSAKLWFVFWQISKVLRRTAVFLVLLALIPVGSVFVSSFSAPFSPVASIQMVVLAGLCYVASVGLESRHGFARQLPRLILGAAVLNLIYLLVTNYAKLLNALLTDAPLPTFPTSSVLSMAGLAWLFLLITSALRK